MPPGKNNRINRREELLRIAREIFAEKGFEATTISEIVSRAGVAQGTFYWYFPSKKSLMLTLAKDWNSVFYIYIYCPPSSLLADGVTLDLRSMEVIL